MNSYTQEENGRKELWYETLNQYLEISFSLLMWNMANGKMDSW